MGWPPFMQRLFESVEDEARMFPGLVSGHGRLNGFSATPLITHIL